MEQIIKPCVLLQGLVADTNTLQIINCLLKETIKETSYHYGHPYLNTATIAGVYRIVLKKLAKKLNKKIIKVNDDIPRRPWYFGREK